MAHARPGRCGCCGPVGLARARAGLRVRAGWRARGPVGWRSGRLVDRPTGGQAGGRRGKRRRTGTGDSRTGGRSVSRTVAQVAQLDGRTGGPAGGRAVGRGGQVRHVRSSSLRRSSRRLRPWVASRRPQPVATPRPWPESNCGDPAREAPVANARGDSHAGAAPFRADSHGAAPAPAEIHHLRDLGPNEAVPVAASAAQSVKSSAHGLVATADSVRVPSSRAWAPAGSPGRRAGR